MAIEQNAAVKIENVTAPDTHATVFHKEACEVDNKDWMKAKESMSKCGNNTLKDFGDVDIFDSAVAKLKELMGFNKTDEKVIVEPNDPKKAEVKQLDLQKEDLKQEAY